MNLLLSISLVFLILCCTATHPFTFLSSPPLLSLTWRLPAAFGDEAALPNKIDEEGAYLSLDTLHTWSK
jgi:hypothetical protein